MKKIRILTANCRALFLIASASQWKQSWHISESDLKMTKNKVELYISMSQSYNKHKSEEPEGKFVYIAPFMHKGRQVLYKAIEKTLKIKHEEKN